MSIQYPTFVSSLCRAIERVKLEPSQQAVVDISITGDNLDDFLLPPNSQIAFAREDLGVAELQIAEQRAALPSNAACRLAEIEKVIA